MHYVLSCVFFKGSLEYVFILPKLPIDDAKRNVLLISSKKKHLAQSNAFEEITWIKLCKWFLSH